MARYLKVEVYPSLFNPNIKEPKTLEFPFETDLIYFKTTKGWFYAEARGMNLYTAILDEKKDLTTLIDEESCRIGKNYLSNNGWCKLIRMFEDLDIYTSVIYK